MTDEISLLNSKLDEPTWLPADTRISLNKTVANWLATRQTLLGAAAEKWEQVFGEFLDDRLESRYLRPIKVLQDTCNLEGEGFSIVAIQCSLVEFLEAIRQGKRYRNKKPKIPNEHEYYYSGDMFIEFLSGRKPFSDFFDKESAKSFYVNVRCGVLHEARTNGGWLIHASDPSGRVADAARKIVYRNNFQHALEAYMATYREQISSDPSLQEAFLRKFDDLCSCSSNDSDK